MINARVAITQAAQEQMRQISTKENGYEYTNASDFINRIDTIVHDPEWRVMAGKRSEEIAAAFDKKAFGNAIEEVYKSTVR